MPRIKPGASQKSPMLGKSTQQQRHWRSAPFISQTSHDFMLTFRMADDKFGDQRGKICRLL